MKAFVFVYHGVGRNDHMWLCRTGGVSREPDQVKGRMWVQSMRRVKRVFEAFWLVGEGDMVSDCVPPRLGSFWLGAGSSPCVLFM